MEPIKSIAIPGKRARGSGKSRVPAQPAPEARAKISPARPTRPVTQTMAQPKHLYRVGQRLRMLGGGNRWARVESLCKVVVLLPYEGSGSLMYRVRSEAESYERVVAEMDLQPVP